MAKVRLPILPFPGHIDRQSFGHYVSGFSDGEAYFCLRLQTHAPSCSSSGQPIAQFVIGLRADDVGVLRLIQSFFGCGILECHPQRQGGKFQQPVCNYRVKKIPDLLTVLVPHFEAFPLHAKKARDFLIWSEGIRYIHHIRSQPPLSVPCRRVPRWWTKERLEHFAAIRDRLSRQRSFDVFTGATCQG